MDNLLGKNINIAFEKLNSKNFCFLESFNCGNIQINNYFQKKALNDNDSVTYLYLNKDNNEVITCVSISCSKVDDEDEEKRIHSSIPAFEIKYFATNNKYHKLKYKENSDLTLSRYIMDQMIYYIYDECATRIGGSKIILYSVKRAENFYKHCHFKNFEPHMKRSEDTFISECIPMYTNLYHY